MKSISAFTGPLGTAASNTKEAKLSGFSLALIANLLWGTSFIASKYTLETWGPFTASVLRFAVAIFLMSLFLPLAGFQLKLPRKWDELKGLFVIGILGFGFLYPLQLYGLKMISSGLSAAIMLTSPLFLVGFGTLIMRQPISPWKIISLLLGLIGGCILLFVNGKTNTTLDSNLVIGSLLTLAASGCLALSVVATKKVGLAMNSANLTFWSMLIGLIVLVPFSLQETPVDGGPAPNARSVFSLLYLAVVCSVICFLVWNRAISKSSPKDIATTMHTKTPMAVVLGVLIANESVSVTMVIGTLIVASGVILSQSEKPAGPQ